MSFFNVSSHVKVNEGMTFQLNCTPQGNPLLTKVTWIKDPGETKSIEIPVHNVEHFIVTNDSTAVTLTVSKSVTSDTGYYCCQFPGVDGPVHSNKIHVTIEGTNGLFDIRKRFAAVFH